MKVEDVVKKNGNSMKESINRVSDVMRMCAKDVERLGFEYRMMKRRFKINNASKMQGKAMFRERAYRKNRKNSLRKSKVRII